MENPFRMSFVRWADKGMVRFGRSKPHLKFCSFAEPIKKWLYTKFLLPKRSTRVRKNYSDLERPIEIRVTAHARGGSAPSSGAVFPGAFELSAWAQTLIRL
jgi:hypothetical protein